MVRVSETANAYFSELYLFLVNFMFSSFFFNFQFSVVDEASLPSLFLAHYDYLYLLVLLCNQFNEQNELITN